jgi:hypothetical protein
MSLRQPDPGVQPAAPPRTPITPPPAVQAFDDLARATDARDFRFRSATAARKALRRFGWSVAPCAKGGG